MNPTPSPERLAALPRFITWLSENPLAQTSVRMVSYFAAGATLSIVLGGDVNAIAALSPALALLVEKVGPDLLAGMLDRLAQGSTEALTPDDLRTITAGLSQFQAEFQGVLTEKEFYHAVARQQQISREQYQSLNQSLAQITERLARASAQDVPATGNGVTEGNTIIVLTLNMLEAMQQGHPPPPPPPGELPEPGFLPPGSHILFRPNARFTGRAEALQTLARHLLHEARPTLVTQLVQGMGGIGKTQLAVEFAHRYGRYFRGVHWINAAQPDAITAEIALCGMPMAAAWGQPWPSEQPEQVAWTLAAWQRQGAHLVIFDNLEDPEVAEHWLGRLSAGDVRVLITARRAAWSGAQPLETLPLELFTREESRAFLRRHPVLAEAAADELDRLADRLGHLPLALSLAAQYLQSFAVGGAAGFTIADYLAELAVQRTTVHHESLREGIWGRVSPTEHDLDLLATFELSWRRVADATARDLFRIAGCCAPQEPIPPALLQRAGCRNAAGEVDGKRYARALRVLTDLGLLHLAQPDLGPTIYPLLAEYAAHLEGAGKLLASLADALARMTHEANETGLPAHFVPLRPHIEAATRAAEEAGLEDAGTLWNSFGYHLNMIADYAGARAAFQRALAILENVLGPEHPNVATLVNNLGLVLKELGDLAGARAAFQRALRIDAAAFGPEHPHIARDVNNLGLVLQELGDLAGARAAYERALRIWQASYGEEHPQVATGYNNLGSVLQDLGDLAGARAAFQRALRIDEAAFGPEHPEVARDVNNLGRVLQDLGDLAGARVAYERALRIDAAAFGPEHPEVATLVNNLGLVLQDLGDLAGARAAYERALRIDEAAFGPEHPHVATRVNNLGSVLKDLGDLAGARAAYERALAIFENVLGSEHPHVATLVNNLGLVLQDLGDLAGARAACERALHIDEAAFGPEHPHVATDVNNLGLVLKDLGDLAGARAAFQRALRIDAAAFGPEHPHVARDVNNLGRVLHNLGDLAGARAAYERALRIDAAAFGPEHPHVATDVNNLGSVLYMRWATWPGRGRPSSARWRSGKSSFPLNTLAFRVYAETWSASGRRLLSSRTAHPPRSPDRCPTTTPNTDERRAVARRSSPRPSPSPNPPRRSPRPGSSSL